MVEVLRPRHRHQAQIRFSYLASNADCVSCFERFCGLMCCLSKLTVVNNFRVPVAVLAIANCLFGLLCTLKVHLFHVIAF